jgi:hypothetical protein
MAAEGTSEGASGGASKGASRVTTAWGTAALVERVIVPQRAGAKRFASVVELLERADGERIVRFAYTTDGVARRGPVSLRARDLERLHTGLAGTPELAALLGGLIDV